MDLRKDRDRKHLRSSLTVKTGGGAYQTSKGHERVLKLTVTPNALGTVVFRAVNEELEQHTNDFSIKVFFTEQ